MQATLRHLEETGAVERRTSTGRGRTAQLHVTRKGHALIRHGRQIFSATDAQLNAALSPEHQQQLVTLLLELFTATTAGSDLPPRQRSGGASKRSQQSRP